MTQEQEKALNVVEKLISDMSCHSLSVEEVMILIQGILSNECNSSCPIFTPSTYPTQSPNLQSPNLIPAPPFNPGDVWCGDHPKIDLYSTECTTTLEELINRFKFECKKTVL